MPRYFFVLKNAVGTIAADDQGEELPDDAAAHEAALQTARELADWERVGNSTVVVKAQDGRLVTEVPLKALFN